MGLGRVSIVGLASLSVALGLVALVLLVGTRGGEHAGRQAARKATAAPTSCGARLLHDWTDGRIDGTYAVSCYRSALKSMPADLEIYSSAPDDIAQALSARIVQGTQKISGHHGAPSVRNIASAR